MRRGGWPFWPRTACNKFQSKWSDTVLLGRGFWARWHGRASGPRRSFTATGFLTKCGGRTEYFRAGPICRCASTQPKAPDKPVETPATTANMASMDAPNPSATPTFASRTPLRIGAIGLIAPDLDRLTNYYRDLLGLTVIDRSDRQARLGFGGT